MSSDKKMPDNNGKTYKRRTTTPRVNLFKQYYLDVNGDTFCNIRGSAIKAGYSPEYAENISHNRPKWWVEFQTEGNFRRAKMLDLAEQRLQERLEEQPETKDDKKMQTDVSKFISERVGKEYYSTRQELTDKGGKKLFSNDKDSEPALQELFVGVKAAEDAS